MNRKRKVVITITYNEMGIIIDTKAEELDLSAQPDNDRIWEALSKVYNMDGVPDEAKGIIGDVMLGLDEPSAQPEPCNGCGYLGESCVGEGCEKLKERKDGECNG